MSSALESFDGRYSAVRHWFRPCPALVIRALQNIYSEVAQVSAQLSASQDVGVIFL